MAELIDREALAQNAQTYSVEYGEYMGEDVREVEMVLLSRVMSAPHRLSVPVVHCKDCLEAKRSENAFADADCTIPLYECGYMTQPNRGHEYCSWGRRKEQV